MKPLNFFYLLFDHQDADNRHFFSPKYDFDSQTENITAQKLAKTKRLSLQECLLFLRNLVTIPYQTCSTLTSTVESPVFHEIL